MAQDWNSPTQAALGMHDQLASEAVPLGKSNVPLHPGTDFANLNKRSAGNVDNGHGGGQAPGSESSFGASTYCGGYGGGYG